MTKYKWNPFTSNLDGELNPIIEDFKEVTTDAYVPFNYLQSSGFKGIKGQWSFFDNKLYKCVATDTWLEIADRIYVDSIIDRFQELFEDQFVPYEALIQSNFKGLKGQWSYSQDFLYLCIATGTWKVIGDKNYTDAQDAAIISGAGLEPDGSYLADESSNYIQEALSLYNADQKLDTELFRVDSLLNETLNLIADQYIPFAAVELSNFKGVKGTWSFNNGFYYLCVATDTWLTLVDKVYADSIPDTIFSQFANQYVPCCLVPNNSAPGLKGQWSFQVGHSSHKGYVKICVATDTWVRFEVETLF